MSSLPLGPTPCAEKPALKPAFLNVLKKRRKKWQNACAQKPGVLRKSALCRFFILHFALPGLHVLKNRGRKLAKCSVHGAIFFDGFFSTWHRPGCANLPEYYMC